MGIMRLNRRLVLLGDGERWIDIDFYNEIVSWKYKYSM